MTPRPSAAGPGGDDTAGIVAHACDGTREPLVEAPRASDGAAREATAMMTRRRYRLVPLAVVLVLAAGACSSSGSGKAASPTTTTGKPAPAEPTSDKLVGHVWVINLENENYDAIWGPSSPARYLNATLRPQGQLLTQYFAIGHASLDNYIAEISGQSPNPATQSDCVTYSEFESTGTGANGQALGSGCVYPKPVQTIGDQLDTAGKSWKAYQEDIGNSATQPKTCRHPAIGAVDTTVIPRRGDMYATRHDPFVYFHSVIDEPSCATNVIALGPLAADLQFVTTTPALSFITPNVCNDGHDSPCKDGRPGGLKSADAWLKQWVPRILAAPAFKADGLLVITFDEAETSDSGACCHTPPAPNTDKPGLGGPGGGRVGALILSPFTKPGTTNPTPYNHYALLCSLENVWGLSHLGFAGAPGLTCFGKDVYDRS
jgi:hypothetical protein